MPPGVFVHLCSEKYNRKIYHKGKTALVGIKSPSERNMQYRQRHAVV